ncbi:FAD-linked oxidoreductase-like protein [Aspergillus bertholletiae]|uniref:proline dehydrogenase n=1 Tax=Aspergillus bertholletiae TaxID=1226010 RepID=A0A5N7AYE2_9EURO|nr:FAD-linked oxidoreductase-like protein [Aspergillus bertholletiae]
MLWRSLLVATISSHPWLLTSALRALSAITHPRVSLLDVNKNAILRGILKTTFYNHFCAGENAAEVTGTIGRIKHMGFKGVILTYAREIVVDASSQEASNPITTNEKASAQTTKSAEIEAWRQGVLETVEMVGTDDFLALKLTGAGPQVMHALSSNQPLPEQMMLALQDICTRALERNARIFVDAEQQSVQSGIDAVALDLMRRYNRNGTAVVYNTYQAYLKSTPENLLSHLDIADKEGFTLGVKLVRGAYINSEPRYLINDTKLGTDDSYNAIAAGILRRQHGPFGVERQFPSTELFLATHNKESALAADALYKERLAAGQPTTKVQYGQLLGMADEVSCRLLQLRDDSSQVAQKASPEVYKCLSWGTLGDCLSYLLRRAVENRDAVGRTTQEYFALKTESCRRRKVKCSGDQPCRSCVRHNWECVPGHAGRRRYTEAHVQNLLDKIRLYEEQLSAVAQAPPPTSATSARNGYTTEAMPYQESDTGISPATDLTSGPAFESQVKSLLDRNHPTNNTILRAPGNRGSTETVTQWTSARPLVSDDAMPTIPSLEESQHLLDRFLFYLGVSQHFFDPRTFSDCMVLLFHDDQAQERQMHTIWFTEYLLVMAMAKLMDVEDPSSQPPGASLFAEAMRRLPPLHQLGEEGAIAVEILTLIATYLQWCDRKHDAYLHIGLALRLAIALGCDKPAREQRCLPSETAHRVRLWWTVYMLDRRLSSGLGLAAGSDERQLRAELPRQAIGFQSPIALAINVRIARATDEIMSSLYGNASITQMELVHKIQKILQDLYETGRSFPPAFVLDFSRPLQTVTRTGASLYLMLFQAIILCTRPVLLQRVRLEVQGQNNNQTLQPLPAALGRLCETCNEAATKGLAILHALKRQQTIPRYGFFDLDATFSGAFVLVMMGLVDKPQDQPPPALDQAFDVLRFLSRAGNLAAERRLQDITHSCLYVWPNHILGAERQQGEEADGGSPINARDPHTSTSAIPPQPPPQYTAMATDGWEQDRDESRLLETWMHPDAANATFDMQVDWDWDLDLSVEAEGIYSSFFDPSLPLTGVDHSDWLEIEKIFNGQNEA